VAGAASSSEDATGKDASDVLRKYDGKIVSLRDLDKEVVEHLGNAGGNESPGAVVADFNGDGITDIAVLTKEPDGTRLALRVFLCRPECKQVTRVALGEFNGLQYLTPLPAGTAVKTAESLAKSARNESQTLRHAGIKYWVFGKAHVVYFWNRRAGTLVSVTTGD
jgi:hypothetical protein